MSARGIVVLDLSTPETVEAERVGAVLKRVLFAMCEQTRALVPARLRKPQKSSAK